MGHLQVKNVPDELHAELRRRATTRHQSVREYLLELIRRDLARPTLEEWFDVVESRPAVQPSITSAELVRAVRDAIEEGQGD